MKKIFYLLLLSGLAIIFASCKKDDEPEKKEIFTGEGTPASPVVLNYQETHHGKVKSNSISYYSFKPGETGVYEVVFSNVTGGAGINVRLETAGFKCTWCDNLVSYAHTYQEGTEYGCMSNNLTKDSTYQILVSNEIVYFSQYEHSDTLNAEFDIIIKRKGNCVGSIYDPVKLNIGTKTTIKMDQGSGTWSNISYYYFTASATNHIITADIPTGSGFQDGGEVRLFNRDSVKYPLYGGYYIDNYCNDGCKELCIVMHDFYKKELNNLTIGKSYGIEIASHVYDFPENSTILVE